MWGQTVNCSAGFVWHNLDGSAVSDILCRAHICSDGSEQVKRHFTLAEGKVCEGSGRSDGSVLRAGSSGVYVPPTPGTPSEPESLPTSGSSLLLFALGFPHRRPPWLREQGWTGLLHAWPARCAEFVYQRCLWGRGRRLCLELVLGFRSHYLFELNCRSSKWAFLIVSHATGVSMSACLPWPQPCSSDQGHPALSARHGPQKTAAGTSSPIVYLTLSKPIGHELNLGNLPTQSNSCHVSTRPDHGGRTDFPCGSPVHPILTKIGKYKNTQKWGGRNSVCASLCVREKEIKH